MRLTNHELMLQMPKGSLKFEKIFWKQKIAEYGFRFENLITLILVIT